MSPTDSPRDKNLALALLAMAQFVVVLDASIVNVALPSIGRELDFAQDDLSWVINSYTLFFGGFLLLGGRLADLLGRRRMFIYGMWLFALASLAGGLAQSDIWLIVARAVQGLGAALISPAALAIVTTTFREGAERNKALGVWGAVAGSGGAAGVLLGGILTESLGWEWVLFVNVPIGIAAALIAPRLLGESRDTSRGSFDIAGAVSVTAGLALLVYTLVDANDAGWASTQTLVLGAVSLALLAVFVAIELRTRHPLVPFSIFRQRTLRGANVVGLLLGMSLFSMFFFISLYMQQVLGYEPLKAGLAYLPLALTIIVSAGVASALVTRIGFKPTLIAGMLFIAAGLVWFAQVSAPGGSATSATSCSRRCSRRSASAWRSSRRRSQRSRASSRTRPVSRRGSSTPRSRSAARSGWRSSRRSPPATTDDAIASGERNPLVSLTAGFQDAFLIGAGMALLGALLAAMLISSRDSREHAEAARRGEAPVAAAA